MKLFLLQILSSTVFLVEIRNGNVFHCKGAKHPRMIADIKDVIAHSKLKNGIIYIRESKGGIQRLMVSNKIPADIAQRLRNLWSFYS